MNDIFDILDTGLENSQTSTHLNWKSNSIFLMNLVRKHCSTFIVLTCLFKFDWCDVPVQRLYSSNFNFMQQLPVSLCRKQLEAQRCLCIEFYLEESWTNVHFLLHQPLWDRLEPLMFQCYHFSHLLEETLIVKLNNLSKSVNENVVFSFPFLISMLQSVDKTRDCRLLLRFRG